MALFNIGYIDPVSGTETGVYWENAIKIAASSNFAGYNDWRVPNVLEITGVSNIALLGNSYQWTSTNDFSDSAKKWFVDLKNQPGVSGSNSIGVEYYLRLVRNNN